MPPTPTGIADDREVGRRPRLVPDRARGRDDAARVARRIPVRAPSRASGDQTARDEEIAVYRLSRSGSALLELVKAQVVAVGILEFGECYSALDTLYLIHLDTQPRQALALSLDVRHAQ